MGLTHPTNASGTNFFSGKYGSILIYRTKIEDEKINQLLGSSRDEILRQMCQHVIGKYNQFNLKYIINYLYNLEYIL